MRYLLYTGNREGMGSRLNLRVSLLLISLHAMFINNETITVLVHVRSIILLSNVFILTKWLMYKWLVYAFQTN